MRTPFDDCLLCQNKKATRTNSHWIPATLLKSLIGKRDKEESYNIDANTRTRINEFYGRCNLKNTDPSLKEHHYARDYIFCDHCENRLSILEGIVPNVIQDQIRDSLKASNYEEAYSFLDIPYKVCKKLDNCIFSLFIYSLVWRYAIIYKSELNKSLLPESIVEKLRVIIDTNLDLDISKMTGKHIENFNFQVITADGFKDATENIVYSEEIYENPTLFFINEFIVFFYHDGYALGEKLVGRFPFFKSIIEFPEILNEPNKHPKIGFISSDHFRNLTRAIMMDLVEVYTNKITKRVSDCSGMSYIESRAKIYSIALEIHQITGLLFSNCVDEAAKIICEEYDQ